MSAFKFMGRLLLALKRRSDGSEPHSAGKSGPSNGDDAKGGLKGKHNNVLMSPLRSERTLRRVSASCPKCSKEVMMDEILVIEGPLYARKGLVEGSFTPLTRVTILRECSSCGHRVHVRAIVMSVETAESLLPLVSDELGEDVKLIKEYSGNVRKVLESFLI